MSQELDQDIQRFWALIFDIVADVEKRLSAHMMQHGLTPPQFYVLKTLMEQGGRCRIGEIAEHHHLTNATMTGLVKRLEALDPPLVVRTRSESDGRSVDVALTEAGTGRYWAVWNSLMEQAREVLHLLPAQERAEAINKAELYFNLLKSQFPADEPDI